MSTLPSRSTTRVFPFGLSPKSGVRPTFWIFVPSTSTAAFSTGGPPLPSMSFAFRKSVGASGIRSDTVPPLGERVPARWSAGSARMISRR